MGEDRIAFVFICQLSVSNLQSVWLVIFIIASTMGGQKVLSLNVLDYNFFTIYMSVKSASFTDFCESAAYVTSL